MKTTAAIRHSSSPESEEMIETFLTNHAEGVLSTMNRNGTIQNSIITTFNLGNFDFAFITKKQSRKYNNLISNPIVSYISFDLFGRTEAEIEGFVLQITDKSEQKKILKKMKKEGTLGKHHVSPYVSEKDDFAMFVIYPRKIHMTTYLQEGASYQPYHELMEFEVSMSD